MLHAVTSREQKLASYFERIKKLKLGEEVEADLSKHGIVLICGYIERSVETIVIERISKKANPTVINFVKSHFKRGTNYDCEPIKQLLARFDQKWSDKFGKFMGDNENIVSSVSSAYALRNSIAHGGDGNRGLQGVLQIFDDSKLLVQALAKSTQ